MTKTHNHLRNVDAFIRNNISNTQQTDPSLFQICGTLMAKMTSLTMTISDLAELFAKFPHLSSSMDHDSAMSYVEVNMFLTHIRASPFLSYKSIIGFKNRSSIGRFLGQA